MPSAGAVALLLTRDGLPGRRGDRRASRERARAAPRLRAAGLPRLAPRPLAVRSRRRRLPLGRHLAPRDEPRQRRPSRLPRSGSASSRPPSVTCSISRPDVRPISTGARPVRYGQTISPRRPAPSGTDGVRPVGIIGMNHAVLYVRDARRQQRFYTDVLGFTHGGRRPERGVRVHAWARLAEPPRHRLLLDRRRRPGRRRRASGPSGCTTSRGRFARSTSWPSCRRGSPTPAPSSATATTAPTRASTPTTPTGSSSRSCGSSPAELWGDEEHEAIVAPPRPRRRTGALRRPLGAPADVDGCRLRAHRPPDVATRCGRSSSSGSPPASSRPVARCHPSGRSREQFAVARTSVREALQGLISLGVVNAGQSCPRRRAPAAVTVPGPTDGAGLPQGLRPRSCSRPAACSSCRSSSSPRVRATPSRSAPRSARVAAQFRAGMPLDEFRRARPRLPHD